MPDIHSVALLPLLSPPPHAPRTPRPAPPCTRCSRPHRHCNTCPRAGCGPVLLDVCAAGSEAVTICLTSPKLRPCIRKSRCASALPPCTRSSQYTVTPGRSSASLPWLRLGCRCIQHRSLSRLCHLVQRPCATRARTLTARRGGSLPGLEARQTLHGTSEHADGPAGSRPGTLPRSSLWRLDVPTR